MVGRSWTRRSFQRSGRRACTQVMHDHPDNVPAARLHRPALGLDDTIPHRWSFSAVSSLSPAGMLLGVCNSIEGSAQPLHARSDEPCLFTDDHCSFPASCVTRNGRILPEQVLITNCRAKCEVRFGCICMRRILKRLAIGGSFNPENPSSR